MSCTVFAKGVIHDSTGFANTTCMILYYNYMSHTATFLDVAQDAQSLTPFTICACGAYDSRKHVAPASS